MWELRSSSPMLDVRLFKDRRFGVSSIGMTLVFLTMFGFFFVVSQLFQLVLGYGPFESGSADAADHAVDDHLQHPCRRAWSSASVRARS